MANRERKRGELRKRKRRGGHGEPRDGTVAASATAAEPEEGFQERMARRAEERNAEARSRLEPLAEGERPQVLTVGAVISGLIALVFTASAVVAAIGGVEVRGSEPTPLPLAAFSVVLWMMALGMWRARYWAVLGFQMLLVLLMLSTAAGLVGAQRLSLLQGIGSIALLGGLGALFYFMIKAMARIQMPERPGA
ncbi:MAG TPA: hypothetical protein VFN15_02925 [Solirubrobacterales bacterium]|nr:hypothetical protein [Solirubrobacterales bacterium]